MTRTNIDIDDGLVEKVMGLYNLKTRREAVDLALRKVVGNLMTKEEALAMQGNGWDGDFEALRGHPIEPDMTPESRLDDE